jgi:hypothetical protein
MAYRAEGLDYAVQVEGRLVDETMWVVDAAVGYRPGVDSDRQLRAFAEARSSIVTGIRREAREGYRQGAALVRVHIDGDPAIDGMFTMTRPGSSLARVA